MSRNLHNSVERINLQKYGKAPTWEQIEDFLKEVGMSGYQFERFYGISFNHLSAVKSHSKKNYPYKNSKTLAVKYWHIFYERIKPAYGVGFIGDYVDEIVNGEPRKKEVKEPTKIIKTEPSKPKIEITHSRLDKLK